ncbi:nucleoside hydrolase [Microbacterium forte]|uniref:nucleoside hydrolase n=1 Tax=Microbacterium forte TaxID=2982533 RepID=UPI002893313A|nr:nucleoside hydrolase [Microbacterium sp. A(2022)]
MAGRSAPWVYIDVDTGIDDALALSLLVLADSEIAGVGTVSGNVSAKTAAENTRNLLALLGAGHVPVAEGAAHPLVSSYTGPLNHVHGENGIGNVHLPTATRPIASIDAADLLIALAHERPDTLDVIAVGPLTNLALALHRDPTITSLVRSVTVMGGAVAVPGNVSETAEANFYADPEAADIVLRAAWEVTVVPLDVTLQHTFDDADQDGLLTAGNPGVEAVAQMLTHYLDFHELRYGERRCAFHDALAAAIAIGVVSPALSAPSNLSVDISTRVTRGSVLVSQGRSLRHRVVHAVEGDPPRGNILSVLGVRSWSATAEAGAP